MTPPNVPAPFDRGTATPDERRALWESLLVVLGALHQAGMLGDGARLTDAPPPEFGQGAAGPLVVAWQREIGAAPDGRFGPKTAALTRSWARAAGFGDRVTVSPAMWALAFGVSVRFEGDRVLMADGSTLDLAEAERAARQTLATMPPE